MKPDYSYKITKKVQNYIEENQMTGHGDSVVVGLSGGADSVCLLLLLNRLKETLGFNLHAVHINHGIRGESAKRDEEFSWKLCERLGIPFMVYEIDVPKLSKAKGISVEEAGREARYACFYDFLCEVREQSAEGDLTDSDESYKCVKIAVAHHMDDQAETVIFNMIRGSGLSGIGGMNPVSKRDGMDIIRPLLCLTRAEITEYLKFVGQDYCTDETNADNDYSRNQIRNIVIPGLNEIQPRTSEHIAQLAMEVREAKEYMDFAVEKLFKDAVTPVYKDEEETMISGYSISIEKIKSENPIIGRELIIYILKQLITTYKDITKSHICDVYSLISKGKGKRVNLPYGLIALREKKQVSILYK